MAVRRQSSATSLSRHAIAKSPGVDLYNGSTSRDFCNSFWGVGDAGVNILFARMRGATRTTDELRNFWKERAVIEEEYSNRLLNLAKATLGKDEIGELRNSLDTLRLETEKQGTTHLQLASQIRTELEVQTTALLNKQIAHRKNLQTPLEKRFKVKQTQESYVLKAREKYESDCLRIASYTQQIAVNPGKDVERLQLKLRRAQQTVQANEKDFASFTKTVLDMMPGWEKDWKEFCDTCQDLEEDRLDFMKDIIWMYANAVSTLCVSDDQSCERIRTVLDQLEPDKDVENFVQEYGTGNSIPDPPVFVPYPGQQPDSSSNSKPTPGSRPAQFVRASARPAPAYPDQDPAATASPEPPAQALPQPQAQPTRSTPERVDSQSDAGSTRAEYVDRSQVDPAVTRAPNGNHVVNPTAHANGPTTNGVVTSNASPRPAQQPPPSTWQVEPVEQQQPSNLTRRVSGPLPPQPPTQAPYQDPPQQLRAPTPPPDEGGRILFYVKALYDYTATIAEEFDFQAGDVIAVTATPDDGWWSGELLDEARREGGQARLPEQLCRVVLVRARTAAASWVWGQVWAGRTAGAPMAGWSPIHRCSSGEGAAGRIDLRIHILSGQNRAHIWLWLL
ncbi:SH3-domain-containing protein [Mycena sanguinolenta]|uniref:SH3-domain-containing protein n=1 Tax=Mycena sanguinolenta TaxID=230812 RepID=A0A8H6XYX8_9AGAR|nr:SH3-domain-containing protein [Mycena sanguinolenta]